MKIKRRLHNLTVTVEEGILESVRIEAAERKMSVSRFVGELLRERSRYSKAYQEAMRAALAEKPLPLKGPPERYPTREELYDRPVLRRH
jgi:hypothetical protein